MGSGVVWNKKFKSWLQLDVFWFDFLGILLLWLVWIEIFFVRIIGLHLSFLFQFGQLTLIFGTFDSKKSCHWLVIAPSKLQHLHIKSSYMNVSDFLFPDRFAIFNVEVKVSPLFAIELRPNELHESISLFAQLLGQISIKWIWTQRQLFVFLYVGNFIADVFLIINLIKNLKELKSILLNHHHCFTQNLFLLSF